MLTRRAGILTWYVFSFLSCWGPTNSPFLCQSYERQPPGTTFFWILDQPENGGGDTLFLSQVEAYKRLSPEFQKRLEGLRAVHSAVEQAEHSRKRGGPVRREPVETEV